MKGSDVKYCILYNFMYMKFCTVGSYGDKKSRYMVDQGQVGWEGLTAKKQDGNLTVTINDLYKCHSLFLTYCIG